MTILSTRNLGKDYGRLVAVESLDLDVARGEIFGLLGPNGAGKTTAISMISGILTPSRGSAEVGGQDVRNASCEVRGQIGLVPQDIAVYEDLTARQNLSFFGKLYGLRGSALQEAQAWSLGVAGLSDRADESVSRYSGGMKRRLNLTVGLLHRPTLLVLDEPTVGVDAQSRAHIFEVIRKLNQDHGITVIYTSHYMEEVEELCTRIGILDHGKLVALDSLDNLLRAHGTGCLEITVDGDAAAVVRVVPEARLVEGRAQVPVPKTLGSLVHQLESADIRLRSIAVHRSDLETVFLNLTGRTLRDEM